MKTATRNIAMWSGPRNLSTAVMRSFAQRADCQVWDEPFYGAYLAQTGLDHPMRDAVIEAGIIDPGAVISACIAPPKSPGKLFYQKHMTHHMVLGLDLSWMKEVTNAFLIRSPERVLASYAKKKADIVAGDLGYEKQRELFERACEQTGEAAIVIDSTDIRKAPRIMLSALCERLEIDLDPAMLSWAPGPGPDDGVWGEHWYDSIWKSTGFAPPDGEPAPLPDHLRSVYDAVLLDFQAVAKYKITLEEL